MIRRQMALWPHGYVNQPPPQPRGKRRKTSEKRQRTARVTVRLLPTEHTALAKAARHAHISVAELLRVSALERITNNNNNKPCMEIDQ